MTITIKRASLCATILLVYITGFGGKYCEARLSVVQRTGSTDSTWSEAYATFYEGSSNTFGGACNYKDTVGQGYGLNTTALSSVLFNDGRTCGACYEIKCARNPQWCKPGKSIIVTATDHCPPNLALPSDNGGWCNHPREHFDIAKPVFSQLAEYKAGITPVDYRRVPCKKKGGVKFKLSGNEWFYEVVVMNVAAVGDILEVEVKGDNKVKEWTKMKRDWGSTYNTHVKLKNECLSFRVTASDNKELTFVDVAPNNWQSGKTYEGDENFS